MSIAAADPATVQAQLLAWIGVALVVLPAMTVLLVKMADLARSVRAAWGDIHAIKAKTAALEVTAAVHEKQLDGLQNLRIRETINDARNDAWLGPSGPGPTGHSDLHEQSDAGIAGAGNAAGPSEKVES